MRNKQQGFRRKRTGVLLFSLIVFTLLFAVFFSAEATEKEKAIKIKPVVQSKIEPTVFKALDNLQDNNQDGEKIKVIVKLRKKPQHVISSRAVSKLIEDKDMEISHSYKMLDAMTATVNSDTLEELQNNPDVEKVYVPRVYHATLDWSVQNITALDVWAVQENGINITGAGETACVIDTGIDYDHSALAGRVVAQQCFCTVSDHGLGGCCPNTMSEDSDASDDDGHGTHVSGIIASNHITYHGVAPGANIVAIKALDNNGAGHSDDVARGIEWCIDNKDTYNISVISMSLGGNLFSDYCDSDDPTMTAAVNLAVQNNISVVAATGNDEDITRIGTPACIENSTAVGATNANDDVWDSSNRNILTDLMAPGTSIRSAYLNNGFATASGTSMATPHVSGAILLLNQFKRLNKGYILNPNQLRETLNLTGTRINDTENSGLFFSRISVAHAINLLDDAAPDIMFFQPENITPEVYENSTLEFNHTSFDRVIGEDLMSYWFLDNELANISQNYTYRPGFNDSGYHNITLIVADGTLTAVQEWNVTVNNMNRPPYFVNYTNISITETEELILEDCFSAQDPDGDELEYFYSGFANQMHYNTTIGDAGIHEQTITASDGNSNATSNITINIIEIDIDSDGINSSEDFILYNITNVTTNLDNLSIEINGSTELARHITGVLPVVFRENNTIITEFSFNFTNNSVLNLANMSIERQSDSVLGSILISNLTLALGYTKSVFIANLSYADGVCVHDTTVMSIDDISENCTESFETFVPCPGTRASYSCEENGTMYKITGLNHSAVIQKNDTQPPRIIEISANSPSGTGAQTVTLTVTTDENATCRYERLDNGVWNSSIMGYVNLSHVMVESMTSSTSHTGQQAYGSSTSGTYYVLCNDSFGNVITEPNSTSFTATVNTEDPPNNPPGGGGGGGGAVAPKKDVYTKSWAAISSGQSASMNIDKEELPVTSVSFKALKELKSAELKVERLDKLPNSVSGLDAGTASASSTSTAHSMVYSYLEFSPKRFSSPEIGDITISFKVNKSWLTKNGLTKSDVKLYRYSSSKKWNKLATKLLRDSGDVIVYESKSPGFSYFAIAGEKTSLALSTTTTITSTTTTTIPSTFEETAAFSEEDKTMQTDSESEELNDREGYDGYMGGITGRAINNILKRFSSKKIFLTTSLVIVTLLSLVSLFYFFKAKQNKPNI